MKIKELGVISTIEPLSVSQYGHPTTDHSGRLQLISIVYLLHKPCKNLKSHLGSYSKKKSAEYQTVSDLSKKLNVIFGFFML